MNATAQNSLARGRRSSRFLTGGALAALALGGQLPRAQAAGLLSQGNAAMAAIPSSIAANLAAEQQGQAVAAQAENQLARVNAALQGMQNMQTAARNLAFAAPSAVPEGLQPGGLVPLKPASWTGAQKPVQSGSAAAPTVTVNQTAAQAILSWSSFNVGRSTTVDFNQQGNTNWVALNQITSPTSSPSQILGSIKASGQVYLINQNGIIFGGTSQVNVGSLIASAAGISDSQFLTDGIYSVDSKSYTASFTSSGADITVQKGAIIDTSVPASVSTGGGFVLLLGKQVQNAGSISTPDGQTALAAGDNFVIRPGYSTTSNDSSTTRGNEIAVALDHNGSSLKPGGSGLVENTGEITSDTGDITLVGETVQQNGVAVSTTSVSVRGTIHLLSSATDPFSNITLGSNASTLIEPDLSSTATELDSQRAGLIADAANANSLRPQAASGQFNDLSLLGDLQDESRIEIVSGNTVEFQNGSDSSAAGGQIAVSAVNRVQVDDGAVLDVSGSYGVSLPMSSNDIQVNVQNYELRDNPQNRLTGGLSNSTVNVNAQDISVVPATTADSNVRDYTQGGLFEVSGYLANVEHTIGEYTALGGQVTLSTGSKGAIVAQAGSTLDINGGSLQYQSGYLAQSYLVGTNGQLYNANNAPAYLTYSGVYTGFTVDHARWNASESYVDSLKAPPEIYQQGYTEGRAAGTLTLSSPTTVFDGTLDAGTTNGPLQTAADPASVSDPYLYTQSDVAEPGTLEIAGLAVANLVLDNTDVTFAINAPRARNINVKIPKALAGTTTLSSTTINNAGLGGLQVLTNGSISVAAPLRFAPGAQVGLYGSSVDIAANITAAGGSVTASQLAPGGELAQAPVVKGKAKAATDIVLAKDVTIDTAGLWTNLLLNPNITFAQAFINGGAVDLASVNSLILQSGSLIDSSAGGDVGLTGTVKGGAGGAITLEAAIPNPATATPVGNLKLRGRLISIGATSGGALTLHAPSFLITSHVVAAASAGLVTLDPAFFRQGFSAYNLQSTGKITVASGTVVNVTEPTYQATAATLSTPTGAAPARAFTVALLPLYVPNSTSSAITQRSGASFSAEIVSPSNAFSSDPKFISATTLSIGTRAAINVDPGQSIALQSVSQLTIDGSLSAPGGSITATSLFNTQAALPGPGTASIWLGPSARLNVSGKAVSFENAAGNRISLAPAGGMITLGSDTSTASVIIRQGAVVSASGSAATDVIAGTVLSATAGVAQPLNQPIAVEGAGGSIAIASEEGIYNNGTLVAAAGGPSAAGGSLAMTLEADLVLSTTGTEATPRIFNITQNGMGPMLAADLKPGSSKGLRIGTASISAQQIAAGGFGNVTLFSRDAFVFHGDVTLRTPQSISLKEGFITDSSRHGSVTLDAPYVLLSGNTPDSNVNGAPISLISGFSAQHATGVFTVNAAAIEINNALRFGGLLPAFGTAPATDLAGFGTVNLNSSGDLQFVAPVDTTGNAGTSNTDNFVTTANVTLTAREIYAIGASGSQTGNGVPITTALVVAGYDPTASSADGNFNRHGTLTILRTPGTTAAAPDTLAGRLIFIAPTINQGGVIWQPLGGVTFGDISSGTINNFNLAGDPNGAVNFLNGSMTSVSAAGLNIPFGGTTDGVNYNVDGALIATTSNSLGLDSVSGGVAPGTITIAALQTDIQSGATLDLRGGGTLTGAGFISGEGGSTDVLTNPLLSSGASGVVQPSLASDPVYAILAGAQPVSAVAYTQSGVAGSVPSLGQQIIIPAGVPGLAAGTYTLLPAQYALEPGGYRVEFDGGAALTAASVGALPNGSYAVAGYTALAGTNIRGTLATNFTVTPGATVLNYADYDQEDYAAFLLANAARLGELRPVLPIDAGTLVLNVPTSALVSVTDAGAVSFAAAAGGIGGTLQIGSGNAGDTGLPDLDFYGTAPATGLPKKTVSLSAAQIDAFHPFILEIGVAGDGSNAGVNSITLENGAVLTAARVVLTAQAGGITLDSGSGIDTINQGTLAVDSTTEGLLNNHGATVLDVGNGYLVYGTTTTLGAKYGPITVQDGAEIYTDGSIDFSTGGAVDLGVGASYGGKYIDLAVPVISVSGKGAGGNSPTGVVLTEAVVQALTRGVPAQDVPAVQILNLTAFDSLNLYGNASLDLTNADVQLEIDTPAIYGFGNGTATIGAGTIVWNGISTLAADGNTIVSSQPGTDSPGIKNSNGTLDLNAQNIILGYSSLDIPQRDVSLIRLADGFSTVNLNASSEITANNQGTLAVYKTVPQYGSPGTGGTLNLNSPLLTAADGATIGFTAGGDINVNSAPGVAPATSLAGAAAGGEIDLTGADIAINSAVILPSGKLNLQATGNITLAGSSLLNLAGAVTTNNNETVYGFGGDLVMASAAGDITQDSGSVINVGATGNTAGSVAVTATAAGTNVALLGSLIGASTGGYDSGTFNIRAQNLGDFTALNNSLDAGGFFQSRSFDIAQGDLTIGNGVQAHDVSVSLDNGSLTVTGTINASGNGGGVIDLSASGDLILASTAVLDAHGTTTPEDSYGQVIASENSPSVSLTSGGGGAGSPTGELVLETGAIIDMASADQVARGDLELNAPRTGPAAASATDSQTIIDPMDGNVTTGADGPANAQGNDIAISAAGPLNIIGAATIALNGTATYKNAPADPNDSNGQIIDQAYLDLINTDSMAFMGNAAVNPALAAQIAGLTASRYISVFHLRPGVQIVSATPEGDISVDGDINLAGYRYSDPKSYGLQANGVYGYGEPGTVAIRAGGNLNVYGSITDGFEKPIDDTGTEFNNGMNWVIFGGGEPYGQNQVLPIPIKIAGGSSLPAGASVNFAAHIAGGSLPANAITPVPLTVTADHIVHTSFIATSEIFSPSGAPLFMKGALVPVGSVIPAGAKIAAGGSLPFAVGVGPATWLPNVPITVVNTLFSGSTGVLLQTGSTLPAGALLPAGSALNFAHDTPGVIIPANGLPRMVETRPNANDGQLYGIAAMLPQGELSWSINLVAGSDISAAGTLVVRAASALGTGGNLTLADTHYGVVTNSRGNETGTVVPAFSVIRTGTGALNLVSGGSLDEESSFGIYTAGTQSAAIMDGKVNPYDLKQGVTKDGTVLGAKNATLAALVANYQADYPTGGGNVLVAAQRNLNGFISTTSSPDNFELTSLTLTDTDALGGWLWRQGGAGELGAWWINFGGLDLTASSGGQVQMTGFQGIGTLGGGNLTVSVGGNASQLNLAVASNGRVTASATPTVDGGGSLDATIGGAVNFTEASDVPTQLPNAEDGGGLITDLRGNALINAGSIGSVQPIHGTVNGNDPRFLSPFASEEAGFGNGFDLALGDASITVDSRGDLAIGSAVNPGTVQNTVNTTLVDGADDGVTDFSLWTASTSIALFSAGGDVVPAERPPASSTPQNDTQQVLYTPTLLATAQNGDIYFGQSQELAPAPDGQLALLAAGSIIGINDPTVSISGADLSVVATPFNPDITVSTASGKFLFTTRSSLSNAEPLDFGSDTASGPLHASDTQPALIYAANGDILDIAFGDYVPAATSSNHIQQVIAAKPFDIFAGRDIVDSGTLLTPDIFLNLNASDITSITAGRDIFESSFDVAGPGNLLVQAGRNLYQADQGAIDSLGLVFGITPANRDSGASISVLAGVGSGPDYTDFANEFLDPPSTLNLSDASSIVQNDDASLYSWLQTNTSYSGDQAGAYAYFLTLPAGQQDVFLRQLYFAILNTSGLEFNDPTSAHYKSYVLGKDAIASLFPNNIPNGDTAPDTGDITLFGPSGIQTLFGGSIETMTPGGQTIVGVEGTTPPSTAGFITQGSGDIDIYAQDSVLLGESRVITTFGGGIVVWSELGNINAGRGSKTTIDYTPVARVYDNYGDVFLSPTVPSSGAGIATLAPIPGVAPGNINLIAPVGTVDAGEAGIRGSGNLNIAALHVLNAANIQVQGGTTGVPTASAPNVGALTSASSAAGAATAAAENSTPKQQAAPQPSIWIVEILGYGGSGSQGSAPVQNKRKHSQTVAGLSQGQTNQASLF